MISIDPFEQAVVDEANIKATTEQKKLIQTDAHRWVLTLTKIKTGLSGRCDNSTEEGRRLGRFHARIDAAFPRARAARLVQTRAEDKASWRSRVLDLETRVARLERRLKEAADA